MKNRCLDTLRQIGYHNWILVIHPFFKKRQNPVPLKMHAYLMPLNIDSYIINKLWHVCCLWHDATRKTERQKLYTKG
jgi:hypothetical protein